MPYLTALQAAAVSGQVVRRAVLVSFAFADAPAYYWQGYGPLRTADNQVWQGAGTLGEISDLDSPVGTSAPVARFTMSGVDVSVAAKARAGAPNVRGRLVQVMVQFYTDELGLVDSPVVAWTGVLDLPKYSADGTGRYTVTISAETEWVARNKPPFGFLTDTDQQVRFPGDRGLELVASLVNKAVNWPS